jgi:uncharacterized protein YdaU (DUF1376 family)
MSNPPAFQLYAADFLVDTLEWDIEEIGIYTRLLYAQWTNGDLPDDINRLARIAGCASKRMQKAWKIVSVKFIRTESGRLINLRLEETRIKQAEYSESQKERAERRWNKDDAHAHATAHATAMPEGKPKSCSSSSSSSSIKTIKIILEDGRFKNIPPSLREKWKDVAPGISIDDEIKKAELWIMTNPEKRRSKWGAFLSNWMVKAQSDFIKYGRGNGNRKPYVSSSGERDVRDYKPEEIPVETEEQRQANIKRIREFTAGIGGSG